MKQSENKQKIKKVKIMSIPSRTRGQKKGPNFQKYSSLAHTWWRNTKFLLVSSIEKKPHHYWTGPAQNFIIFKGWSVLITILAFKTWRYLGENGHWNCRIMKCRCILKNLYLFDHVFNLLVFVYPYWADYFDLLLKQSGSCDRHFQFVNCINTSTY